MHQDPRLDPIEVVRVENMKAAITNGTIELPGIGTAKITGHTGRVLESFPPQRTTIITIELSHSA
jgi:hypothetical protein